MTNVDSKSLVLGFADSVVAELQSAWRKIVHCLEQLSDEQLWDRSASEMNSIANLLLHLDGNLRQWIVAGLSGTADTRNRPSEFAERGPIARETLVARLSKTLSEAERQILDQSPADLLRVRKVQGFDVSGFDAILSSVSHFRGHCQEIVHMTRALLGADYRFDFVPQTPEQGAPSE
ncbi:MAG: DUF1572 family protein [Planctomycetaceae bacterium]|nr:DUF1572 family protein [Planctomycetales bacterium]MCB9925635.1 DUF1572 family protein [Planctomycetaceae bacterium]